METTVPDLPRLAFEPATGLPLARRLQAVGFRSWPAATTTFDGAWAIRLN